MALLTGPEIHRQVRLGGVTIDPFDPARLGQNSYDLTLAPELLVYAKNYPVHRLNNSYFANRGHSDDVVAPMMAMAALDMAAEEPTVALTIPPTGLVLWPGVLYLGATAERAGSDGFVPRIDGRSSAGRLGLSVHVTAGLGDQGFGGRDCPAAWTLEITVCVPLRVYAGARVCQVTFETVEGQPRPYRGQYAGQTGPRPSGLWRDFAAGPVPAPAAEPPPGDPPAFRVGDAVRKVGSGHAVDYEFEGVVRSAFRKASGLACCAVEDARGVLMIYPDANLERT